MGVNILGKLLKREADEETNYLALTITPNKILASIWKQNGEQISFEGYSEKEFNSVDSLIHEAAVAIDSAAKNIKSDVSQVVFGLSNYWFEDDKPAKETEDILKNLAQKLELDAQAFVPLSASITHFEKIKGNLDEVILIGAFKNYTEISLVINGNTTTKEHKGDSNLSNIKSIISDIGQSPEKVLPKTVIIFGDNAHHIKKELEKYENAFTKGTRFEIITNQQLAQCIAYSQAADVIGHEPTISNSAPVLASEELVSDKGSEFEFIEGGDILKTNEANLPSETISESNVSEPVSLDEYAVEVDHKQQQHYQPPPKRLEESQSPKKKSIMETLTTLNWTNALTKGGKKKLLIPVVVLVLSLLAVGYLASYTLTSAQVLIKASSKPFEDTFDVTVASGAALDTARSRIPGEETTSIVAESSQTNATGTKKTGNSAKGEVKVLNWTTSSKSFDANTIIISKNGVKFELTGSVQIASRSASTPGESTVSVEAQDFGTNGNVSSGSEFTFQQHDELLYSAKSENAFSGGDEKEITVITKQDQDQLSKKLQDSLTQKAKDDLKQKVQGQNIKDESIEIKVLEKQFDKNIDQEGSTLTLDMEIQASALSYREETLKELLSKLAQESGQASFESKPENVDILELDVTRSKGTLNLEGKYRANLTPKVSEDEIKTNIAGKSQKSAREIIKQNPDISGVEFSFSPNLAIFSSLPKNKEKITIKVEAIK